MTIKPNKDHNATTTVGQQGRENKIIQNPVLDKNTNNPEFKTNNLNKTSSKFDKNVRLFRNYVIFLLAI